MIKLSKIIKFKEGITRHKEEEFRKYSLKGWSVAGCSTQYIIVEKELQYDEAICLEGGNWPLIYVVEKDNSFGIIDEYGKEICPCQFVKYEYEYAWDDSKNPSSIILWTNIGNRHTYDRKTSKISILDKETLDVMNKPQEKFWASIDDIMGVLKMKNESLTNDDFGLSETNPILTRNIIDSQRYLHKLVSSEGELIKWERIGSVHNPNHGGNKDMPVDVYKVETESGIDMGKIYISPYCEKGTSKAPVGFKYLGVNMDALIDSIFDED